VKKWKTIYSTVWAGLNLAIFTKVEANYGVLTFPIQLMYPVSYRSKQNLQHCNLVNNGKHMFKKEIYTFKR
jgi:hypothetical protein